VGFYSAQTNLAPCTHPSPTGNRNHSTFPFPPEPSRRLSAGCFRSRQAIKVLNYLLSVLAQVGQTPYSVFAQERSWKQARSNPI
jgi:hypothetical protein